MSKKCPRCKFNVYLTELKHWYKCPKCQTEFPERAFPKEITLFHRITESPEVLARKVVYPVFDYGNSIGVKIRGYRSPFLDDIYPIWNLAFEKTLAKLKEVCDGNG